MSIVQALLKPISPPLNIHGRIPANLATDWNIDLVSLGKWYTFMKTQLMYTSPSSVTESIQVLPSCLCYFHRHLSTSHTCLSFSVPAEMLLCLLSWMPVDLTQLVCVPGQLSCGLPIRGPHNNQQDHSSWHRYQGWGPSPEQMNHWKIRWRRTNQTVQQLTTQQNFTPIQALHPPKTLVAAALWQ